MACVFCEPGAEQVLWRDSHCRVLLAAEPDYPAFCRVIWQAHMREMTDLDARDRAQVMNVVFATERALRDLLAPDKVNLASLGNQVPHLHWHVIPRWSDDAHFPDPVWAARRRAGVAHAIDPVRLAGSLCALLGPSGG